MTPPIVQAVKNGDFKEVRKLIHEGCDINERDSIGCSALFWAVLRKAPHIAELLIMNGADINLPTNLGRTPLSKAAIIYDELYYDDRLIRILLNNRADLNSQDSAGHTALHYAVSFKIYKSVEFLLKAKADVNIKNKKGIRPPKYTSALPSNDPEMHSLFEKAEIEFEIEEPKPNSGIQFENP